MLIIADYRLPQSAKDKLCEYGKLNLFDATGIVESYISGHSDIFIAQHGNTFICAPNTPSETLKVLKRTNALVLIGERSIGKSHPLTAAYNVVLTDKYLIHNPTFTDSSILSYAKDIEIINVKQAYTRCSLLSLGDNSFITSDASIYNALTKENKHCLLVKTDNIILPGLPYGLFGGCCGVHGKTVFIAGSLRYHVDGTAIAAFINSSGFAIVELYDGPLFDGGGVFFVE